MSEQLIVPDGYNVVVRSDRTVPALIAHASPRTVERYLEFFAAHIRNPNTRAGYLHAARRFFAWCETADIYALADVRRLHVASYVESLTHSHSAPTVKQHISALKMLFAFLREPQENPVDGVRGPRHSIRKGKTPVMSAAQARQLLDSIEATTIIGLRDRALIALMIYTFGRVSAVTGMEVEDYYLHGTRRWVRLHEKGGKEHTVPVHHRAEEMVDAYLAATGLLSGPLFRTTRPNGQLDIRRFGRLAAWEMLKRRGATAGLPSGVTNHSCRASGITIYLENGGTIENARNIAAHASIITTQTYDRRDETITLDEISRIRI